MKSETRLQQEIIQDFNNKYPEYRGLLNYNLNNSRDGRDGKHNKFLGLIAGRSDLVFYFKGTATMIELKTLTGSQKPAQVKWQRTIESQGFKYYIVRTRELAAELLENIIKNG